MSAELRFTGGTVEVHGVGEGVLPRAYQWDPRTACFRAPASAYAEGVLALRAAAITYADQARRYAELPALALRDAREPRPYQREGLDAWLRARGRGAVVLPTGAGKTHVALMAIAEKKRSAIVVAPTLDLVQQWYDALRAAFDVPVGVIGGGEHAPEPLTVTTYDSLHLHAHHLGARFGLAVFDECHHLPSEAYALGSRSLIAPFRLGLTATPERADGREALLAELVGPLVYRKEIGELEGEWLASYDTERVEVALSAEERAEYDAERALYRAFVTRHGIRMSRPDGWSTFIVRSSRSPEGRRAMAAYRRQRELALCAPAKLSHVERLLEQHRADRSIVFTEDNATVHRLSRRFLIPAITHHTKVRERSRILAGLAEGTYGAVATSKVLNEGVDVPDANVAIVVSGNGSVREHVQRLGRILRRREGKRAILYELVATDTNESFTSDRRREHEAYRVG